MTHEISSDHLIQVFSERWGCDASNLTGPATSHLAAMIHPISVASETFDGKLNSLKLRFNGRWGNYVFQLINIFHLAERLGVTAVYLHSTEMFPLATPIKIDGISIEQIGTEVSAPGFQLESVFFHTAPFAKLISDLSPDRRREIALKYVRPLMTGCKPRDDLISDDDIVIHIRSGDLFQGADGQGGSQPGGALYVQPPLSFYMMVVNALRRPGTGNVVIITEDTQNPTVIPLVEGLRRHNHAVTLRCNHDLTSDIGCLMAARSLVFANGTIGLAVALCSNQLENGYFFRTDGTGTPFRVDHYIGDFCRKHFVQDKDEGYINKGGWQNTREQREAMVSYPESALCWDYEAPRKNVALHKPTQQSSSLPFVADGMTAVNGIITGSFSFHTDLEQHPWWEVDLLDFYEIAEIVVFNRCDVPNRAFTFQIWLMRPGSEWELAHDQQGRPFGGVSGKPARIVLNRTAAKVVRIQLPNRDYLHLDEVEVYTEND